MSLDWSYGITTVPQRLETTLPVTIKSLARTGFDCPTLFMDGYMQDLDPSYKDFYRIYGMAQRKLPLVIHPHVGHLSNWMTALIYLYTSAPNSDRYAIFEDDLLAVSRLREYLEQTEYKDKSYFNLLTHGQNLLITNNVEGWHPSNQMGRGAVGLVFDRKAVQDLMASREFVERPMLKWDRKRNTQRGGADGMVIDVLKRQGYVEYIHNPSLLQHIGEQSILKHSFGKVPGFRGEDWDPMRLVKTGCQ